MAWITLGLLGLVGYGVYRVVAAVCARLWETVSPERQEQSLKLAKDLPDTVFNAFLFAITLVAVGATAVHWLAFPEFASGWRQVTSWGPETVPWLLAFWLFQFWNSPGLPSSTPPRGRSLVRSRAAEKDGSRHRSSRSVFSNPFSAVGDSKLPSAGESIARGRTLRRTLHNGQSTSERPRSQDAAHGRVIRTFRRD